MMFSNSSNTQYTEKNEYLDGIALLFGMIGTTKMNRARIVKAIQAADSRCPLHSTDIMYATQNIVGTDLLGTAYLLILADEVENYPQFIGWLHNDPDWKNRK